MTNKTVLLHTKPTPYNKGPDLTIPSLCNQICLGTNDHMWTKMETFISRKAGDLTDRDIVYCQECSDLITPMEYLNLVEL